MSAEPPVECVRTSRLEIVDEGGRLRAVLGCLPSPDRTMPVFGLAILDPDDQSRPRTWLSIDRTGPKLVFDLAGNDVLTLGVHDPTDDATRIGAFAVLTDEEGIPIREFPNGGGVQRDPGC